MAYWKSLEDVLTNYIRHDDHKYDYTDHIAKRKHVIVNRIRYMARNQTTLMMHRYLVLILRIIWNMRMIMPLGNGYWD